VKVQLYIKDTNGNYQRADLFQEEEIEIKSSIQDAKDLSKIFTDFTQEFNIPASDTNNKIFKHFYEPSIDDGFNPRVKKDALLYINHNKFREGSIFMSNVLMRDKKPFSYKVVFYGKSINIKDILGDTKLSALTYFSDYDHAYDYTTVKDIFQNGKTVNGEDNALIYPIITSKKRLFYDSDIAVDAPDNFDGNLYVNTDARLAGVRGLSYSDLKPAVKVTHVIDAIEDQYPQISFVKDDFIDTEPLDNLYLWCSNKSGNIIPDNSDEFFHSVTLGDFQHAPNYSLNDDNLAQFISVDGNIITIDASQDQLSGYAHLWIDLTPNSSDSSVQYYLKTYKITDGVHETTGKITGTHRVNFFTEIPLNEVDRRAKKFKIEVYSKTPMTFDTIGVTLRINLEKSPPPLSIAYRQNGYQFLASLGGSTDTTANLSISNQLPDMKIYDFLSGLFKLYNLTAFYIDDEFDDNYGKIKLLPLDDFYNDCVNNEATDGVIDITEYIDTAEHDVSVALPFKSVKFEYKENSTLLMEQHTSMSNEVFGNSEYSVVENYENIQTGKEYKIKVGFDHLKYERLIDIPNGTATTIQWGYAAGGDFNPSEQKTSNGLYIPPSGDYESRPIKALLFYGIKQTDGTDIEFNDNIENSANANNINDYFIPSNGNEIKTVPDGEESFNYPADHYLNFDDEFDEYTAELYYQNSLIQKYYEKYLRSILSPTKRLYYFVGYLPASFLLKYKLNDQLKIQDRMYRINSITTNLNTGKSKLELLNLDFDEIITS